METNNARKGGHAGWLIAVGALIGVAVGIYGISVEYLPAVSAGLSYAMGVVVGAFCGGAAEAANEP